MDNLKYNEIIRKLDTLYDFTSPYIDPKKEELESELVKEIEKDTLLASSFFTYILSFELTEVGIKNLSLFSKFLVNNKQLKSVLPEKDFNFHTAMQYVFTPFITFQIPIALWSPLAKESWSILKKYNSNQFTNIDDFSDKIQPHLKKCSELLDTFREHPIYGDKIKAADWGYV